MTGKQHRVVGISIIVSLFLLLVITGVAVADLPAQETSLTASGYAREINADAQGNLWITEWTSGKLWWVNAAGNSSKTYSMGGHPFDASPDNLGNVWWVTGTKLSSLSISTNISTTWTIAGSGYLHGVSIENSGRVWIADSGAANVYSFDPSNSNYLCTYPFTDTYSSSLYPFVTSTSLWLGDSGTGALVSLDYTTDTWTRWGLPGTSSPSDIIVDLAGNIWFTDDALPQIGRFSPTSNVLNIYTLPIGSSPIMVAISGSHICYTEQGSTLGCLDPSIAIPTTYVLTPATDNATSSCSRLRNPSTGSVTPANGTPTWTAKDYSRIYNQDGWTIFQLPVNSQPFGIAFTSDGYYVDSFRQALSRFPLDPTPVRLTGFHANSSPDGIQISWQTAEEIDLLGFNLYRAPDEDGPRQLITPQLIPAISPGELRGNDYHYLDTSVEAGKVYYYWVEWVGIDSTELIGPVSARFQPFTLWLPMVLK